MHLNLFEAVQVTQDLATLLDAHHKKNPAPTLRPLILCVSAPLIYPLSLVINQRYHYQQQCPIVLGAQAVAAQPEGAYTGWVSASQLRSVGSQYVIVGHSERRQYAQETDADFVRMIQLAHGSGLRSILCVGETEEQYLTGNGWLAVQHQLQEVVSHLRPYQREALILAYEPVWAIGTGRVATPEYAQHMHQNIRNYLAEVMGADKAQQITILYGGSVKPDNARALFSQPDIDGGLVGGASLKADSLAKLYITLYKQV
jgi:triosephosphate isomerase